MTACADSRTVAPARPGTGQQAGGDRRPRAAHFGLTVRAKDGTKARYAFVYGDFRRIHRMGLIACSYRAAESRHKELLHYLDTKSERRREALIVPADAGLARPPPSAATSMP